MCGVKTIELNIKLDPPRRGGSQLCYVVAYNQEENMVVFVMGGFTKKSFTFLTHLFNIASFICCTFCTTTEQAQAQPVNKNPNVMRVSLCEWE